MGLSTTAAYGILFTASLIMLATLLNSILYSYAVANQGMNNRNEIIESSKNVIEIDRIVYNSSNIEIFAYNHGPLTLNVSHISMVINGTLVNFTCSSPYWYPGDIEKFYVNSTYAPGTYHSVQFKIDIGDHIIASAEFDKIYILNETSVTAYLYSGSNVWSVAVNSPLDLACNSDIYVLNSTEILIYGLDGTYLGSFGSDLNITAIAAYENYVYGVSNTTVYIFDSTGTLLKTLSITDGKDISVGKYLYVLGGNTIYLYSYDGIYISSFTDWRITNATKIGADPDMQGSYIFVLNNKNQILIYRGNNYVASIQLSELAENIDIYGKIYLCSRGLLGMDMGFRVKIVDEYGNEIYGYL